MAAPFLAGIFIGGLIVAEKQREYRDPFLPSPWPYLGNNVSYIFNASLSILEEMRIRQPQVQPDLWVLVGRSFSRIPFSSGHNVMVYRELNEEQSIAIGQAIDEGKDILFVFHPAHLNTKNYLMGSLACYLVPDYHREYYSFFDFTWNRWYKRFKSFHSYNVRSSVSMM